MMTLRYKSFFVLLLMALLVATPALADHVDDSYQAAARKYHMLYKNSSYRKLESNWLKTIKQFTFIYDNYSDHPRAPESLFNIGKLYRSLYMLNGKSVYLDRSSLAYRTLVSEYPRSSLADNAQFLLAENYDVHKKDSILAIAEYDSFLTVFGESDLKTKVITRLNELRPDRQPIVTKPEPKKGLDPSNLTIARYGGLTEAENNTSRPLTLISKVDYWSTSEWSRMVINISNEVRYKYQVLEEDASHPHKRLYIDISHAYIPDGFKKRISSYDGLISQARIAQYDKQTVRIVLDLISLDGIKVFHFPLPNQYKIVIDIIGAKPGHNTRFTKNQTTDDIGLFGKSSASGEIDDDISLPEAFGLKVRKIILDPGHGGKDPGAVGNGLKEKDLTLKVALHLRDILRKNHPELEVLLTRSSDIYVPLEARTAFANKHRGDLFVSIHVNASPHSKARGLETYYLNLTSDNDALNLAAKENQTSMKSISDLQNILNDLLTNTKIQESSELAQFLQDSVVESTRLTGHNLKNLGVKKAPFIVLLGAQMPSVLIELGFLTNPAESDLLKQIQYRQTLATGIYEGVSQYIN